MSDLYVEHMIKRRTPGYLAGIRMALMALSALSVAAVLMIPILIPVPVVLIGLTIFLTKRWNVEYEYLYVNGEIDFDVIMSAAKRKKKLTVNVHEVELMAPLGFAELRPFEQKQMKTYDFTSLTDEKKVYVMIVNKDEGRIKVLFEPTKEIVDGMKLMAPRKVLLNW